MRDKTAIIIPGSTDANRGDQALVWESISVVEELGFYSQLYLIDTGEKEEERLEQVSETQKLGYRLLRRIIPHPRRGHHENADKVNERMVSTVLLSIRSFLDFIQSFCVILFADHPQVIKRILQPKEFSTYLAFKSASTVFVKGGGFLHSYGGLTAPYYTWYVTFYLRLAHRLRVPVIVLPNSFGPFKGRTVRRQLQQILTKCQFVSARESVSATVLHQELDLRVPVYPDLGYYLESNGTLLKTEIDTRYGTSLSSHKCVAFTVRPYRFPESNAPANAYSKYIQAMSSLICYVSEAGYHPVLVTQVAGPSAHENDRLAIQDLRANITHIQHSWIDHVDNCRTLKSIYSEMDFLIGTRFHSVIFAQGAGVPTIAIAYGGNKAFGIMRDLGLGEYVVPIEDLDGATLIERFNQLVENQEVIREKLAGWKKESIDCRRDMLRHIREMIVSEE